MRARWASGCFEIGRFQSGLHAGVAGVRVGHYSVYKEREKEWVHITTAPSGGVRVVLQRTPRPRMRTAPSNHILACARCHHTMAIPACTPSTRRNKRRQAPNTVHAQYQAERARHTQAVRARARAQWGPACSIRWPRGRAWHGCHHTTGAVICEEINAEAAVMRSCR
jgi:hypothetical protein